MAQSTTSSGKRRGGPRAELASVAEPSGAASPSLTDLEAHVLSLVTALQPVTTYEIMRVLVQSPAASLSGSTGTVYPIVRRLRERGYLDAREIAHSPRSASHLEVTEAGRDAALEWVGSVPEVDALPPDPIRSKVMFLGMLGKRERMTFVLAARRAVDAKLEQVEAYAAANPGPYADLAYAGAKAVLVARRKWLEDVLLEVASG